MALPALTPSPAQLPAPVRTYTRCRVCYAPSYWPERRSVVVLDPLIHLGALPPVEFPDAIGGSGRPAIPLDVRRCPRCGLVQLAHTIPPEWRYSEYWYRSGTNDLMVTELTDIVAELRHRGVGTEQDVVVDIGANDGTLLKAWQATGEGRTRQPYRVAFEPSPNLYAALAPHAETVYQTLFPPPDAKIRQIYAHRAKAITAIAMAYAVDDLLTFFHEIAHWLHPDGWAVVQFQDLEAVVRQRQYDYFCHEHLTALSVSSLAQVLLSTSLRVVDVHTRAINGGSLRVFLRHREKLKSTTVAARTGADRVARQVDLEAEAGVTFFSDVSKATTLWSEYRHEAETIAELVRQWVVGAPGPVDLYGASTKSLTLLSLCGLDRSQIRQAWERSSQKVGRFVGATGIPIVREAEGRAAAPTDLLVGIWQFKDAVIAREREFLRKGGRMLVPLPWPEVVYVDRGQLKAERLGLRGARP